MMSMFTNPISLSAVIGMTLGAFIPVWMGIDDGLGGWSVLGGLIGGIIGIWVGAKVKKRLS